MALLEDIKLTLRISHNLLDEEIQDEITSARQEMVRAGVNSSVATTQDGENNLLVEQAIKVYVLMLHEMDVKRREGYEESFKNQLDNLRKSYPASGVS